MAPFFLLLLLLLLLLPSTLSSTLDPKQLTALQSISIPSSPDPCSLPSIINCSNSSPFRHVLSLSLTNCSPSLSLSSTALHSLSSSLLSLSLSNCPHLSPPPFFPPLLLSLSLSFSFSSHSLSAIPLSRLHSLTHLSLLSIPIRCSAPFVLFSQLPDLISTTVIGSNLSGPIPHHFSSLNLTHLNLSNNSLSGAIPSSLSDLIYLTNLSLSRNLLSGPIPLSMSALPLLTHLDLSSNRLNGSVPGFLAEMEGLVYLDLGDNEFTGVLPFNETFIRRLGGFRVEGNAGLCYNKSLVSRKVMLGIAVCDRFGLPASPPPDKTTKGKTEGDYGDDGDDYGEEEKEGGKSGGEGHHGPSVLVLGVAIGLACLVFLVIFVVCLSKICG